MALSPKSKCNSGVNGAGMAKVPLFGENGEAGVPTEGGAPTPAIAEMKIAMNGCLKIETWRDA